MRDAAQAALEAQATAHPMVMEFMSAFPGAKITAIRTAQDQAAEAQAQALPEVEDEWDPFEDS